MKFGVKVMPEVLSFLDAVVTILLHEPLRLRGRQRHLKWLIVTNSKKYPKLFLAVVMLTITNGLVSWGCEIWFMGRLCTFLSVVCEVLLVHQLCTFLSVVCEVLLVHQLCTFLSVVYEVLLVHQPWQTRRRCQILKISAETFRKILYLSDKASGRINQSNSRHFPYCWSLAFPETRLSFVLNLKTCNWQ